VFSAIERAFFEDPDFPYFRRAIQPPDKATIDNADALYLSASIDGAKSYRVRGRVPVGGGQKAPQYIIFEAHTVYAGDTGSLAELAPGGRIVTGSLDIADLAVDDDGRFEILLAPRRPTDYAGNFIATATADGTQTARFLIARMLFHDWEREASPELHIVQVGKEGAHPAPIDPAVAAQHIRRVGTIVENQMRFWNEFYDLVLEAHSDKNGDGFTLMPRNALNEPALANLAMGGGQSTNVYSGGVYDLQADEALLIEVVPAGAGLHGLPPIQSLGRVARLRQPHQQPQRISVRARPRRDHPLCGRRDRPRCAELARHRRPPRRVSDPTVDVLHAPAPIAEGDGHQGATGRRASTASRVNPHRFCRGTPTADQSPPGTRPATLPAILTSYPCASSATGCHCSQLRNRLS
jgi:hypothetical protein